MKLTQLFLCSATLALPLTLNAATQKSDDRWFDVEIILFSQLGDKSQLKENFPETSELPKHKRVEDLLRRYLNPDIRSLKQLLPSCDSPQYGENLVNKTAKLPTLFKEQSLTELALTAAEESLFNLESQTVEQNNNPLNDATHSTTLPSAANESSSIPTLPENANDVDVNKTINNNTLYSDVQSEVKNGVQNEVQGDALDSTTLSPEPELTPEERAKIQNLVLAAEAEFQTLKFQYTPTTEATLLCRIDQANFTDYQVNNPGFDYHGFAVDKMPLLINGQEEVGNNNTHLLSKDSLQLDDIIQDLRYSKNFRPLLHMGWRQVARPEKESVPVKVYAGESFAADHKKKLAHYNKQKNQHIVQALETTSEQSPMGILTLKNQAKNSQQEQVQAAKKSRIQEVIAQLSQVNEDTEALLTSFKTQDLSLKLGNENPLISEPPLAPVQPWFIDGFFNIHLKHYLFITADFNILDKNLAELATAQLAENAPAMGNTDVIITKPVQAKAIRFKQDRRVISGEVHYFDHPYMGMIVQIRPYTKPEPEDE
ncbi:CsiV family protein [Colwellia sp. PAMC 21821]|uniref:CsiV family protein n=1 Tax=Colwellia sp. PAMC 21821 TaxID=1816219 RepID=UPI0009BF38AF|nr:CsiV family protein [Colwellia sp. PAMC 21821]ARD45199.1 hypothetical protein A3Q33_13330 [Colwellia sp. PAMC 21821]